MIEPLPDDVRPEDPAYLEWCEWYASTLGDEDHEEERCPDCGKRFEDWSDLGCGFCDQRSPEFGLRS